MEAIFEVAGGLIASVVRRYGYLPAAALHRKMLSLSLLVTVPMLLAVIPLHTTDDWAGYLPPNVFVYALGIPLILLGEPVSELLQNAYSIRIPSLYLWVMDALLILQWILWGQLLAIVIRDGRGKEPSRLAQEFLILAGGLVFVAVFGLCLLVGRT